MCPPPQSAPQRGQNAKQNVFSVKKNTEKSVFSIENTFYSEHILQRTHSLKNTLYTCAPNEIFFTPGANPATPPGPKKILKKVSKIEVKSQYRMCSL